MRCVAISLLVLAVVTVGGCENRSPVAPDRNNAATPTRDPSATVENAVVSGVVWRHDTTGITPYAGVRVWGWSQLARSGSRIGPTQTGADGRYSFTVPVGALLRVQVAATYQPCVASLSVAGNATRDVHLVVDPAQLGAHLPAALLADTPTLSGLVFENAAQGRQAVPGVRVELDMISGLGDVSATTLTDSDGRYVLCGLGGSTSPYVYASNCAVDRLPRGLSARQRVQIVARCQRGDRRQPVRRYVYPAINAAGRFESIGPFGGPAVTFRARVF